MDKNIVTLLENNEKVSETKVWRPLGADSATRIVADTFGTAGQKTITIHAACELHPDEARAFARQIEGAVTWLQENPKGVSEGLFLRGAWIADPDALPNDEFHKHFCCQHWGIVTDREQRLLWCQYAGKELAPLDHTGPIPIPAWCPKREE